MPTAGLWLQQLLFLPWHFSFDNGKDLIIFASTFYTEYYEDNNCGFGFGDDDGLQYPETEKHTG
jgi:hypothetical protein